MFQENTPKNRSNKGWIEVICGSMFSGKTEELIRRIRRAELAKMGVTTFKPLIDSRYHGTKIVSHNQVNLNATAVRKSAEIIALAENSQVIGIDEAQFFDEALPEICSLLANRGQRVIIAGLDMDFNGRPFGPMPALMATAEYVTKVHAICVNCGDLAHYSKRKLNNNELIVLGEYDKYEPLCRNCYTTSLPENK